VSDAERIQQLEAQLRNTERELVTYKDKIDKDDLIRCLRASRDSYRNETIQLKDRIADLEQQNDGLRDDNMNLSAMMRAARNESSNLKAELVRADEYERELSEEIGDLRCSIRSAWDEINRLQRMEVAA
jgi:chromosome segregation ATPase